MERYRGEDAGDLKSSELDELVDNWTCLNDVERKIWKFNSMILMEEKSWKTWKRNQKVVMDEELVQNVMMDGKIDPKVVMDLSIFKIGGWNILQTSNRKLLEDVLRRMNRDCC